MTPLIIVAFNRPDHLRRVLAAVRKQTKKPDRIIGLIDGIRGEHDRGLVGGSKRELSAIADEIIERPHNYGCATNIMRGISEITEKYDRFLLLEDDVIPAEHWYEAMCLLLDHYEQVPNIGAVGAFPALLNGALPDYNTDVILSPRFSCWGWGSWTKKWSFVDREWEHYKQLGAPPWDPARLPNYAGDDIGCMIRNHPQGQLWDGMVAGTFLQYGLLHAIPRFYLANNIGADKYLPPSKLHFMMSNNPMQERLPATFPDSNQLDMRVSQAVRDYVRAMSS